MKKLTETEFINRVAELHNDAYTYISGFINTNTKVKMYCNRCREYFYIKPAKLFLGQGCNKCRAARISESKRFTNDEFKLKVLEILGPDYEILTEYKNQNSLITLKHITCGTIYKTRATYILNKHKACPYCTLKKTKHSGFKYTNEEFVAKIKDLVGTEYVVLSSYINSKTKVLFRHTICNEEFWMTPEKFIHSHERCPACYHSRGEDTIKYFLKKQNKYRIVSQFKFKDLYYKTPKQLLRFDFALFDQNNNLCYLIEYDGIQHFKLGHWNTEDSLIENKKRDELKNTYCLNNHIPLIRIAYTDFNNIENILKKEII